MSFKWLHLGLALCALAACTRRMPPSDTLRMRLPSEPPTLDWTLATDNVSKEIIQNIQEGLVEMDSDSRPHPGLAESWAISSDGQTYTFKLREGLKWSDGQPLIAQHFVDAWERLLNPANASEYAYFLFDVRNAQEYNARQVTDFAQVGAQALDARTLRVQLKSPVAYWIDIPSFWVTFPVRKDIIAKYGDKWATPKHMVSDGPYMLKEWKHDSKIVIQKNPHYPWPAEFARAPAKAEFLVIKEGSTAVTIFDSGGLDLVRDLPPVQVSVLAKRKEFVKTPYLRGFYIGFNIKDPMVKDVRARRALAMAIDRRELQAIKSLDPMINVTSTWNPPGLLGHDPKRGIAFDPEKARKLWNELPSKPTSIEFWFDQQEFNKIVAENIQSQWKRVLGVDVQLNNQEWKVYLKTLKNSTPAIWRMGWGADYPDPDTFMNLFTCASGNNFTKMCDKIYDTLIAQAARKGTDASRAATYAQTEKILLEEQVAIIPLFTQTNLHLVSERLKNFKVSPTGDFLLKRFQLSTP